MRTERMRTVGPADGHEHEWTGWVGGWKVYSSARMNERTNDAGGVETHKT